MRSITHAHRAAAVLAVAVALTAGLAGTAQAGKGGKPGGTVILTTTTPTTPTTAAGIKAVHDTVCPTVAEYVSCAGLSVTVDNLGATGWTASSGPAAGTVSYNSYYGLSSSSWAQTVSHEVGGHHDAWRELVARASEAQAWTDYYDLDYFGELWAEARYKAVKGTVRDFTRSEGKEIYLDCAGPVAHGYSGNYLTNRGISPGSQQVSFCSGAATVMTDALTKARPN